MVLKKITSYIKSAPKTLIAIVFFAFILRVVGISYGLPLWLVDDEPPFVLSAIKMIQLRTLIPALHQSDFANILYYPPYLAYLYVLPFITLLGFQYAAHYALGSLFIPFVVSDLSTFFIIARFITILFALASIVFIYEIGKNIFNSVRIGILSAFFLSTSLLHIMLSITSRHWLVVSFFGLLVFWILSNPKHAIEKKYLAVSIAAGVGMGFNIIIGTYLILVAAWYLFFERRAIAIKYIVASVVVFTILASLPVLLYPQSLGFASDITTDNPKTAIGILTSPFLFLKPNAFSEPLLMIFFIIGLAALFFLQRNLFVVFFLLLYGYSALFYIAFRYEHRFTVGLLPFAVLLAAYGFNYIALITKKQWIYALLIIPLVFSVQLNRVIMNNDSRVNARTWIEQNIPAHEKILVYARLTRLSSEPDAINEQKTIDSGSLRKVDEAEALLPPNMRSNTTFHSLNLYSVTNELFFENIGNYAKKNNYTYALISNENFMRDEKEFDIMQKLGASGMLIKTFGSYQPDYSISASQLLGNPIRLFSFREFGPKLSLYKILP